MDTLGLDAQRRLTLAATILGSSLAFIDATVVIVALPTIEEDLGLGLSGQQWVFLSYSLALAALYLVGGRDRRPLRAAAGVHRRSRRVRARLAPRRRRPERGGAHARPHAAGRRRRVPDDELARAPARPPTGRTRGAPSACGPPSRASPRSLGPPAGGALVEWASWRWIFLLNLPARGGCGLPRARPAARQDAPPERAGRLDLPGAALAATGFGSLTYGLVEGADRGFGDVWWAFVLAGASLAAFVIVERRVAQPMLPFDSLPASGTSPLPTRRRSSSTAACTASSSS